MADEINDKEDGFLDSKEDDSEPVGNPAPPSDVDLNLLRGDRIGDTVYSGKWCIQTVMKMLQSNITIKPEENEQDQPEDGKMEVVDMEEEFQNEVGVLWDMTSNVEVCQYLQSVGAIESIYHIIANSRCPRATEMCVGMLGNIITHDELWQSLQLDTTLFAVLIPLFSSTDQPVLLELSRFFTTAVSHAEMGQCYSSLCGNSPLVTQELVRILSGSTNCDLLKQTTELTHLLMCVDDDDSHFNALFADADFIAAVLEASKEIGYQQETASQSCIMEILHGFTTYPAGIAAMETCMGSITEAVTKYLRALCHNINLSNSGAIISIIITLLNHIFCRSLEVRIELMSTSKLLQNILKILISLYRRLGLYDSIANPPHQDQNQHGRNHHHRHHRHHHHHQHHHHQRKKHQSNPKSSSTSATATESWESSTNPDEEEEDEEKSSRGSKAEPKSWSERAEQGEATPRHVFATPEPSPKHQASAVMKEMEFLSWSERRMASPLVDGGDAALVAGAGAEADVWKIPQETRKMKKKSLSMDKDGVKDGGVSSTSSSAKRSEETDTDVGMEAKVELPSGSVDENKGDHSGREEMGDNNDDKDVTTPDSTSDSTAEKDCKARGVEMGVARHSTDSHASTGFSPSMGDDEGEADESMECESESESFPAGKRGDDLGGKSDNSKMAESEQAAVVGVECLGVDGRSNSACKDGEMDSGQWNTEERTLDDGKGKSTAVVEDARNYENGEGVSVAVAADGGGAGVWARGDEPRRGQGQGGSNLDKYNTLLNVVREFLSDFFNNFREGLLTEQGVPVISDILLFLDTQCRRSTLRLLVHCLGPSRDRSSPVGRLVQLSVNLKADSLRSVLEEFVDGTERQRI